MPKQIERMDVLRALSAAIETATENCTHPEDVMACALTTVEAVYAFVAALPGDAWSLGG